MPTNWQQPTTLAESGTRALDSVGDVSFRLGTYDPESLGLFGMSPAMPHARNWRAEGSEASLAVGTRARANTPEGDVGAWGRFVAHAGT